MRPNSFAATFLLCCFVGCARPVADEIRPNVKAAGEIRKLLAANADGAGGDEPAGPTEERTGWAALKGRFTVVGTAPSPAAASITKDAEVCAPGGRAVFSQAIEVGSGGGLKNVAVYVRDVADEHIHESAASGKSGEVTFDQKDCVFLSHVAVMQVSQTLKILNSDSVSHNTFIKAKRGTPFNKTISPGLSLDYEPTKSERSPVSVVCSIHPWMQAYLLPLEHSYAAVTSDNGSFEIKSLPAGVTIKIQVWHETLKKFDKATVNGQPPDWKRGVMTLKLEPDEVREIDVKIPAEAF